MKKRKKSFGSEFKKIFIEFCLCNFFLLLCLVLVLSTTQQSTNVDTYVVQTTVVDSYIRNIPLRHDMVYLKTLDGNFRITWNSSKPNNGAKYVPSIIEELLSEGEVSLVVLKKTNILDITGDKIGEAIDIRSYDKVYYDISAYNKSQKEDRFAGVCAVSLFFLLFNTYFAVTFYVYKDIAKRFFKHK